MFKLFKQEIADIVLKAWKKIPSSLIIKGFIQTEVAVALNGSEDHKITIDWSHINNAQ